LCYTLLCFSYTSLTIIPKQYAQKISVSEKMIMHIPDTMSFETAAGIPEVS
jgi:NADPH:quinone reductase-like Zn-dependent oxidoreductase